MQSEKCSFSTLIKNKAASWVLESVDQTPLAFTDFTSPFIDSSGGITPPLFIITLLALSQSSPEMGLEILSFLRTFSKTLP